MNSVVDMESLHEICISLGKSINLDAFIIDQKGTVKFRITERKEMPILRYRKNYKEEIRDKVQGLKDNQVLLYMDNLGLHYLAIPCDVDHPDKILVTGPFLTVQLDSTMVEHIISRNQISLQDQYYLIELLKTIRVMNSEEHISTAKIMLWILREKRLNMEFSYSETSPVDYRESRPSSIEQAFTLIDERYRMQNRIMDLVAHGDAENAIRVMNKTVYDFSYRTPGDPLRAYKSQLLIFNTILRIAIEKTGVPAVAIHMISDNMAIRIEQSRNMESMQDMNVKLIKEYVNLVNRYKTTGYSRHIHKAIQYMEVRLGEKILLSDISKASGISPSHLSRQFRKETGKTITEWMNDRRIEQAKSILMENGTSVTEVAIQCGFENHNYFSKCFRKRTGMTPKEYQKQNKIC